MNYLIATILLIAVYMGTQTVVSSPILNHAETIVIGDGNLGYYMPDSCAETHYCFEKGPDYPDHKIAELLKNIRELPVLNPKSSIESDFEDRQGDNPMNNPDCPANTTYTNKPIYYIVDTENRVRVVIQSPTKFEQTYTVKWCQKPGRITYETEHLMSSLVPQNFTIECANTYMDFEFIVLNDDYELEVEIVKAKSGIPASCNLHMC